MFAIATFRRVLALLSFLGLSALASFSQAYSTTGTATVSLFDTVQFEETKIVDYGSIVNQNGSCSITETGDLVGSNGSSCNGSGQVGEFVISGTPDQSVSVSVSAGESLSGITFTPQLHSGTSVVLAGGKTVAKVGGTLDLNNAAQGNHTLSYTISVNYD